MTPAAVRSLLARRPFVPFDIHLIDGRTIPIRHPELLLLSPGGSMAVAFAGAEEPTRIRLDQVTTLTTTGAR